MSELDRSDSCLKLFSLPTCSLQNTESDGMEIPDPACEEGIEFLEKYFKDKSYCFGFYPTKADALIWEKLKKPPSEKYENLSRWYRHIASYGSERNIFPKSDIELLFNKKEKEAKKPSEVKRKDYRTFKIIILLLIPSFC